MIHKDLNFGGNPVYALLEFGKGDIAVVNGTGKKDNEIKQTTVLFKNINPIPIAETVTEGGDIRNKPVTVFPPEVAMTFTKPESIDVVIRYLRLAKKKLKTINH
jgi:hypothetical protein